MASLIIKRIPCPNAGEVFRKHIVYARHYSKKEINTTVRPTYTKVILSGNTVEIFNYEKPVFYGMEGRGGRKKNDESTNTSTRDRRPETIRNARLRIKRLAQCNFKESAKFLTLTFKNGAVADVSDVKACNIEFKKFIQRLRYRYGAFKYIAVIEFQEAKGRGAVHYHCLIDTPYIPFDDLMALWGNGGVWIEKIKGMEGVDNVGAYITSYMGKGLDNPKMLGMPSYLASRGLEKSKVLRGYKAIQANQMILDMNLRLVFTNNYHLKDKFGEDRGLVSFREYNLKRKVLNNNV